MIELPEFSDTEWYREIIDKLSKSSYIDPMNKMLKKLFAEISYSKYKNISDFSVASFQDIKEIYEKIIKTPLIRKTQFTKNLVNPPKMW